MKIRPFLRHESVIADLKSISKEAVLSELAAALPSNAGQDSRRDITKALLERERLGSTGIGDGIAIPHGKIGRLSDLMISYGRSKKGVEFNSMDGKPVHLFFLMMAPENSSGQHLKVLAKISRMLKDDAFRKKMMDAESTDELYSIIMEKDDAELL